MADLASGGRNASWPTLTVTVGPQAPAETAAAIAGEFSDDGIAGIWEHPSSNGSGTDLVVYFESEIPPLATARVERLFARHGLEAPRIALGTQESEDWNETWRKGFTAFPIGRRFEVVPSWEEPSGESGRIVLSIDPGLAFGTGTHETTQLVLESLEDLSKGQTDGAVVDIGTGTAILAIAARKLGWTRVFACDVDPDAVHVARKNALKNQAGFPLWTGSADSIRSRKADLVLANINAAAITDLLPDIDRSLAPGGQIVLSGILDMQEEIIRKTLDRAGLEVVERRHRGEWIALHLRRRNEGGG